MVVVTLTTTMMTIILMKMMMLMIAMLMMLMTMEMMVGLMILVTTMMIMTLPMTTTRMLTTTVIMMTTTTMMIQVTVQHANQRFTMRLVPISTCQSDYLLSLTLGYIAVTLYPRVNLLMNRVIYCRKAPRYVVNFSKGVAQLDADKKGRLGFY